MAHKKFIDALGYHFKNKALLERALLHDSASKGGGNEHLEFLGDRVLGLVIADMLVARFPEEPEGYLARRLAVLVSRDTCASIAKTWGLGEEIKTEKKTKISRNILANGCEAVLGAIYLDGGLGVAEEVIRNHWDEKLTADKSAPKDSKSRLQEYAMKKNFDLPKYETIDKRGPDHEPHFTVSVLLNATEAKGEGGSIQMAQRVAAETWLATFREKND